MIINTQQKEEIINYIKTISLEKTLTRKELLHAFDSVDHESSNNFFHKKIDFSNILYYIGGIIIILGILTLTINNWVNFNLFTKVLVTLGSGISAYIVGLIFNNDKKTLAMSSVFFFLSAVFTPIGISIILDNIGVNIASLKVNSIIAGGMFITYLLSQIVLKKDIFVLLSIIYGTYFYFLFSSFMVMDNPISYNTDFNLYRILTASISYLLIGYSFSKKSFTNLSGYMFGFGILGFLGSTFALGGFKPEQNMFWELIYPGLSFGTLLLSVKLKQKSFVVFGTISLMIFILKITAAYFSDSIGWPLALVLAGLALIAVGHMSLSITKKINTKS